MLRVGLATEGTGVLVLTETPELAALGDGHKANSFEIVVCYEKLDCRVSIFTLACL